LPVGLRLARRASVEDDQIAPLRAPLARLDVGHRVIAAGASERRILELCPLPGLVQRVCYELDHCGAVAVDELMRSERASEERCRLKDGAPVALSEAERAAVSHRRTEPAPDPFVCVRVRSWWDVLPRCGALHFDPDEAPLPKGESWIAVG